MELQFPDVTLVQVWTANFPVAGPVWQDVVGPSQFQTFNATFETSTDILTINTNWGENTTFIAGPLTFVTADLFLDFDLNGTWDAAIPLFGTDKGKVFYNPTFDTSQDVVGTNAVQYGGLYTTNVNTPGPPSFDVPVTVTSAASLDTAGVIWASLFPNTDPDNSVAIDLSGVNNGFNPDSFAFLWGTADCGNDVIIGTVPLPPSLLLFGSGLLGLLGLGRRKLSKR